MSLPITPGQQEAVSHSPGLGTADLRAAFLLDQGILSSFATHAVQFYEADATLITTMTRFVGAALGMGDAAVVLATPSHRAELAAQLAARGLDLSAATAQGRYVALDAAAMLAQVMRDGQPDAARFIEVIGGLVDRAALAALGPSPRVAAFGELVALLAASSQHAAAITLEQLWNDLAQTRQFSLLCAYPMDAFPGAADGAPFTEVCAAHNHLTIADDPASLADETDRRRALALLRQQARALPTETLAREQAQELLRQREAELSAIVASSDDAIISKTLDGTITSWNHAAERLYGYTAAEIVGRPIVTLVPEDRRADLADIMARLKRGERIAHHETERVHKDGTRIAVSVTISPIHDRTGQIIGASKIARDIRERRALERQKQEFVEMVAHDLGTPLTVIRASAQILQRRQAYDAQTLATIVGETGRMGRLVTDMLEVTRLEAGRLELRRASVDLAALARGCVAQAEMLAGGRRIRLEAPDHPVVGEWDGDRVGQVLSNLLDNALKYAPASEVVVRVVALAAEAQVAVSDQGPGLTPEQVQRAFARFTRIATTAATANGTGLGLFISKELVEAHGGRIWVDSLPGQGATFTVGLPYAPGPTTAANSGGDGPFRTAAPTAVDAEPGRVSRDAAPMVVEVV